MGVPRRRGACEAILWQAAEKLNSPLTDEEGVGTLLCMRGSVENRSAVVMVNPEPMIPKDHPTRVVKTIVEVVLDRIAPQLDAMYAERGRPSIPPETLLKAQILIALYTVRSERLFCERLRYDFLFRWFLDLRDGTSTFDATTFSKNRELLLKAKIFDEFFGEVVEEARKRRLLSDEHFTVDGTLIEANASLKSFRTKVEETRRRKEVGAMSR